MPHHPALESTMSLPEGSATARPVIVQGSTAPVFHGPSGNTFRCSGCDQVLVDGYDPRSLIAVDIECFRCKVITRTDPWPTGEPLPTTLATLGDVGRFLVKGTVKLNDRAAMSCDQEIARVRAGTLPKPQSTARWELSPDSLMVLETELDVLTGGAIQKMAASAKRAHGAGNATYAQMKSPPVWALAQLHSSLSKGQIDLDGPDGIALAYVQTLRDSLHRWQHHPLFAAIARTLCHEFHHGVTAFTVASYLSDHGNDVGVTDTSMQRGKSPDLFINVARNETLSIEVKCPRAFFWPEKRPSKADMSKRIEREIRAARDQITGAAGGLVVIGAGQPVLGFITDLDECIREVVGSGRVSKRVAAVAGIAFYGAQIEGHDANGPRITTGIEVHIARNPRFPGPNPVEIEHRPHGVSRGNIATEKQTSSR